MSTATTSSSPTSTPPNVVGWVAESRGRGTLTLVSTCCITIFLCTWVVIHPRVSNRPLIRWLHKLALFLKTVVAPELIAVEGLQEWSQAKKMTANCAKLTEGRLKMVHAFYIGMLGLRHRTLRGNKVIWPNQFTWLLEQRLVNWDDHAYWGLSAEIISDKSNADGTVKLAALVQVSWFVAQCIMRTAHGLPLSQLESMTISYVPLFAVTYFLWWVKPKDVMTPSIVDLPLMSAEQMATFEAMAVKKTFDNEGLEEQISLWIVWHLTPRVFEKEAEDKMLREAQEKTAKSQALQDAARKAREEKDGPLAREQEVAQASSSESDIEAAASSTSVILPKEIVVSHWDPDLYRSKLWPISCLFGSSFGALHLIAWHSAFPTLVEEWLWRASAITSIVTLLIFMHFEKVVFRWGGPLTLVSLATPVLYLASRLIMTGGVIAAFRAMNEGVYDTYVVSSYWVHVL